jgi:hypothetical protein
MDLAAKIQSIAPTTGQKPHRRNRGKTIPTIYTRNTGATPPPFSNGRAVENGFGPARTKERGGQVL